MDIFDNGLAFLQLEEGQAVHGTDEGITGTEASQFQSVTFLVNVNPQFSPMGVWHTHELNLIRYAPSHA